MNVMPALPWAESWRANPAQSFPPDPALVGTARPHSPAPVPATAPSLVQRDSRATPASVSNVIALGEGIQRSVRQELDEMRAMVSRIGKQSTPPASNPAPGPPAAATGDAVRHLLGRMRTMLQEEQFRRGNIR